MNTKDYIKDNSAFIFQLDNVLYPEKDYLLQVYYLFAQFMEYTEQMDGRSIIDFMRDIYEKEGDVAIFFKTAAQFNLPEKYKDNFELLHQNARLPLKLLMFAKVLSFIQEITAAGKKVFLLADGDPVMQLNKIRQMEWHGIGEYLTVYFSAEIAEGSTAKAVQVIIEKHGLEPDQVVLVNNCNKEQKREFNEMLNFLDIDKLLVT